MNDEDPDGEDESPTRNQIQIKNIPQVLNTVNFPKKKAVAVSPHNFNRQQM